VRVAFVKTSSMGDVIHALPVVSDLVRALPGATVDWVVEEAFAQLPPLHPSVDIVLPVALRRWRRAPWAPATWRELGAARRRIAAQRYDLVLDLQGLLKSAWFATWARGPRAGFSRRCAREPLAALLYQRRFDVDMSAHAIERLRSLAAQALGYRVDGLPVFGLKVPRTVFEASTEDLLARPFAVLLHATSRAEKCWPLAHWRELATGLAARRLAVVLPWGSEAERQQAQAIAAGMPGAHVLPRLSLAQCASLLARATCVVGVDTGLTHLASAIDAPTVALFSATPAWRFGPYWSPRAVALGASGVWPAAPEVLATLERIVST
jgi:heptosyltransferase-1